MKKQDRIRWLTYKLFVGELCRHHSIVVGNRDNIMQAILYIGRVKYSYGKEWSDEANLMLNEDKTNSPYDWVAEERKLLRDLNYFFRKERKKVIKVKTSENGKIREYCLGSSVRKLHGRYSFRKWRWRRSSTS